MERISVLKLIHEQMGESLLEVVPDFLAISYQVPGTHQEIHKIEHPSSLLLVLVFTRDLPEELIQASSQIGQER